jgi:murein DD-endopeptidase MepM/ murein hydrolase activator NlpD
MENTAKPAKKSKLHHKYRLVVMREDTFEEVTSYRLSRFNIYMLVSSIVVLITIFVSLLFMFTGLKYSIPGYGDANTRETIIAQAEQVDSLEELLEQQDLFIKQVGKMNTDDITQLDTELNYAKDSTAAPNYSLSDIPEESPELQNVRERLEAQRSAGQLSFSRYQGLTMTEERNFYSPLSKSAFVTDPFSAEKGHYGIDLADVKDAPVSAALQGTVIEASWTYEDGYVIAVQHRNNFISFYKHNSALLKKVGSFVQTGEAIAIIGDSGHNTSGPHLHFELWHNGQPVNPTQYISF